MEYFDYTKSLFGDFVEVKEIPTKQTVSFAINDKLNFSNFIRDNYDISNVVITMTNDSFDIEYENSQLCLIDAITNAVMGWNACFNLKETKNGK